MGIVSGEDFTTSNQRNVEKIHNLHIPSSGVGAESHSLLIPRYLVSIRFVLVKTHGSHNVQNYNSRPNALSRFTSFRLDGEDYHDLCRQVILQQPLPNEKSECRRPFTTVQSRIPDLGCQNPTCAFATTTHQEFNNWHSDTDQ